MTKHEQHQSSKTKDPKSGRVAELPVIRRPSIAECVLPGHPDRICDRIADLLVDTACARDPLSLVGVEEALHRNAHLAGMGKAADGGPGRGRFQIGVGVHDAGGVASQLQDDLLAPR